MLEAVNEWNAEGEGRVSNMSDIDPSTLFDPRVFARGLAYFNAGNVTSLKRETDGWSATVSGTQLYRTFVPETFSPASRFACTCRHFADGHLCKHLAATCLAVERAESAIEIADDTEAGAPRAADQTSGPLPSRKGGYRPSPDASEIVETLDADSLRSILQGELVRNGRLEREIIARYGALSMRDAMHEFKAQARRLVSSYARKGFIDWRRAMDFEREWLDLVDATVRPFLDRGERGSAFDLACAAFMRLQKIDIDDSDGFFTAATRQCRDLWSDALEEADEPLARRMLDWLLEAARMPDSPKGDRAGISWLLRDVADAFATSEFGSKAEYAGVVQESIDERIERLPEKVRREIEGISVSDSTGEEVFNEANDRELGPLVVARLRTMAVLGTAVDEIRTYAQDYLSVSIVREYLVDDARKRGDTAYAITLLEAAREARRQIESRSGRDGRMAGNRIFTDADARALYDLHVRTGDVAAAREDLASIVAHGGGVEWLRRLKAMVPADEWPALRDSILKRMDSAYARRPIYVEEGMADELLAIVANDPMRGWAISYPQDREFDLLAKTHPDALLEMMKAGCLAVMTSTNRKTYQEIAKTMLRMRDVPGGTRFEAAFRAELAERYPKRIALREELAKVLDA